MKHRADLFEPGCHPFEDGYMCGLGGVIIQGTWTCPECKKLERCITRIPSSGYYGSTLYSECGDSWDDEGRRRRPFYRYWRRDAQRRFELDWDKALPEGTTYVYDIDQLCAVVLPDGTRVDRFKEEERVDHSLPGG